MSEVDIHDGVQLYIKPKRLYAIQISPENLPRIINVFRDYKITYESPSSSGQTPTLTMVRAIIEVVIGDCLDYLVWGPHVKLHVVKADEFLDIYDIAEQLT